MLRFSNWPAVMKLLAVVVVMAGATAAVSISGISAVRSLVRDRQEVEETGTERMLAARLGQIVVMINRSEYRTAMDPSPDTVRGSVANVARWRGIVEQRLRQLRALADPEQHAMLDRIEQAWRSYMVRVDATLERALREGALARRADVQAALTAAVAESRNAADQLQAAVRTYTDLSDDRARAVASASTANAEWAQSFIVVVSVVAVLGGIGVGYLLALLGLSRPAAPLGERARDL